jgi:hypothetical protein
LKALLQRGEQNRFLCLNFSEKAFEQKSQSLVSSIAKNPFNQNASEYGDGNDSKIKHQVIRHRGPPQSQHR